MPAMAAAGSRALLTDIVGEEARRKHLEMTGFEEIALPSVQASLAGDPRYLKRITHGNMKSDGPAAL